MAEPQRIFVVKVYMFRSVAPAHFTAASRPAFDAKTFRRCLNLGKSTGVLPYFLIVMSADDVHKAREPTTFGRSIEV